MSKKFSKKTTTKRQYKLSPKDAQKILRKEFIDSRGNKHIFKIDFKPQNPLKPDYIQTIDYKDKD